MGGEKEAGRFLFFSSPPRRSSLISFSLSGSPISSSRLFSLGKKEQGKKPRQEEQNVSFLILASIFKKCHPADIDSSAPSPILPLCRPQYVYTQRVHSTHLQPTPQTRARAAPLTGSTLRPSMHDVCLSMETRIRVSTREGRYAQTESKASGNVYPTIEEGRR